MLRKMTVDEKTAYMKKRNDLKEKVSQAVSANISNSQMKKLKAQNHNEWQSYIKDNNIIALMGNLYIEETKPQETNS